MNEGKGHYNLQDDIAEIQQDIPNEKASDRYATKVSERVLEFIRKYVSTATGKHAADDKKLAKQIHEHITNSSEINQRIFKR